MRRLMSLIICLTGLAASGKTPPTAKAPAIEAHGWAVDLVNDGRQVYLVLGGREVWAWTGSGWRLQIARLPREVVAISGDGAVHLVDRRGPALVLATLAAPKKTQTLMRYKQPNGERPQGVWDPKRKRLVMHRGQSAAAIYVIEANQVRRLEEKRMLSCLAWDPASERVVVEDPESGLFAFNGKGLNRLDDFVPGQFLLGIKRRGQLVSLGSMNEPARLWTFDAGWKKTRAALPHKGAYVRGLTVDPSSGQIIAVGVVERGARRLPMTWVSTGGPFTAIGAPPATK